MRAGLGRLVGAALLLAACAPVAPTPAPVAVGPRAIAGLTADNVMAAMRARGFACAPRERPPAGDARWLCRSTGPRSQFEVAAWGEEPGRITRVEAAVLLDRPDDAVAVDVLGVVAGALPYAGAEPARARAWLAGAVPGAGAARTTIGGASLEVVGPPIARMLRLTPPPA